MSIEALLIAIQQYRAALTQQLGPGDACARLDLVKELAARLPHKYLLATTKEEIQAAGRSMIAEGRSKEEMRLLQNTLVGLLDHLFKAGFMPWHPIRAMGDLKAHPKSAPEIALVVGTKPERVATIRRVLDPGQVRAHAEPSPAVALDKLGWYPFALVLCAFPLREVEVYEFCKRLRSLGSLCRSAGLVLTADDEHIKDAEYHIGKGVNRVIATTSVEEELPGAVADLTAVRERARVRVTVRAILDASQRAEVWQTENVSMTGMLVRTPTVLAAGSPLALDVTFPADPRPIRAQAEVIRTASIGRDSVNGLGLRLLSFEGDGQHRLELFLRNRPSRA